MTTVPAVLAALTSLAEATLDGDLWQVINGPLASVTVTKDRKVLVAPNDDDVVGSSELDSMGRSAAVLRYRVPVVVVADLPGTDQLAADAAVDAAWADLERAVRQFPDGALGLRAQGVCGASPVDGEFRMSRMADSDGRHSALRFYVSVYAQHT